MDAPSHKSTIELRVRYAETDQMGVVYHAHYLVWCEVGRTELIRQIGVPYAELERQGVILAVSDASIRFHSSARYDDVVAVETWVEEVRSRQLTFRYTIERVDGANRQRLASARTVLTALDPSGRPRVLPASLMNLLREAASAPAR